MMKSEIFKGKEQMLPEIYPIAIKELEENYTLHITKT